MDEFEIIRRFFTPQTQSKRLIVGVGDDGAVFRPVAGKDLVNVVDTMVDGIHFPAQLKPEDIGYRAVAVNVSDMAAMGAIPKWMTLAMTLKDADSEWLQGFARGFFTAAERFGVELIGGDTTHGNTIVISVQITGEVAPGKAITRDGAKPGDAIYVSGNPGDAAFGLFLFQNERTQSARNKRLLRRFTRPDARVELGQRISDVATAAIDISDGLYADLSKLLLASDAAGRIDLDQMPLSRDLSASTSRENAIQFALGGGDDYELCFTVPLGSFDATTNIAGVPITQIGEVSAGSGLNCTEAGRAFDYHHDGYRHFDG